MPQNVLVKTIVYHGHKIYKHKEGKTVYYSVPALSNTFTTLKATKAALDKLDADMTRQMKAKTAAERNKKK